VKGDSYSRAASTTPRSARQTLERVLALVPFVAGLEATFARQWPAIGVEQGRPGHFTRTWPFPDCWPLHPELVMEFAWLRSWTTAVETGDVELQEAHGGAWDRWLRHVREATVPMVREIAQLCMLSGTNQHVDPTVPRPGFGHARTVPMYGNKADRAAGEVAVACDPQRARRPRVAVAP
jgi:hypothetical protein